MTALALTIWATGVAIVALIAGVIGESCERRGWWTSDRVCVWICMRLIVVSAAIMALAFFEILGGLL